MNPTKFQLSSWLIGLRLVLLLVVALGSVEAAVAATLRLYALSVVADLPQLPHTAQWDNPGDWRDYPGNATVSEIPTSNDHLYLSPRYASYTATIELESKANAASIQMYTDRTVDWDAEFIGLGGGQELSIGGDLSIKADEWKVVHTQNGSKTEYSEAHVVLNQVYAAADNVLITRDFENAGGAASLTLTNNGSILARENFTLHDGNLNFYGGAVLVNGALKMERFSEIHFMQGGTIVGDVQYGKLINLASTDNLSFTKIEGAMTRYSGVGASQTNSIVLGENHSLILDQSGDPSVSTIGAVISGSGGLYVQGEANTVQLRGTNSFAGDISVSAGGTLNITRGANLGALGKELRLIDGTLQAGGNFSIGIPVYINDATIDTQNFNVGATNNWTGPSGTITKVGIGVLELNNYAAGYGGNWVVNEGILESAAGDTFANDTTVTVNDPGTLRFTGNENFGAVNGTGLMSIRDNTVKLYKGDALTADFAGRVSGSGTIEKVAGSGGEQRFSGDSTAFTGTWLVNGQMAFASADSLHRPAQIGSSGILVLDPSSGTSSHGASITGVSTSRIHKRGGGTIALTNSNLGYLGSYEVVGGTLQLDAAPSQFARIVIGQSGTLSTSLNSIQYVTPVTIAADGASIDTGEGQIILNGAQGGLKGTGTLHKRGAGALRVFTLSPDFAGGVLVREGTFTYNRPDMLAGAALQIDAGATAGGIQVGTSSYFDYQLGELTGGGELVVPAMQSVSVGEDNDSDYTFSGKLTGDGRFTKVGTGTMTLSGDNRQFGGDFIAASGTLKLSSLNALPDGSGLEIQQAATAEVVVESRASKLQGNGQLRLTGGRFFVGLGDASSTFDGQLTGSRDLWKTGAGTLTLTGNQSSFDGAYMVTGGLLHLANTHPSAIPQITMQGGGIRAGGDITLSKTVFNNGGSIDTNGFDVELTGSLFGNEVLTKKGAGDLRLSGSNNLENTIDVEQGILRILNTSSINGNTSIHLQSGSAAVFEADARLRNLTGRGGVHIAANTLTVSGDGVTEYQGWLLGSGTFDKWLSGELTLSGDASGFSGDFLVRGSGSKLNLMGEYNPSEVFVDINATLGGNADINSLVNIRQFGTLAPGMSAGQMTVDELILYFSSTYEVELGGVLPNQFDSVLVEGGAAINGNLDVRLIDGYSPLEGDSLMVLEVLGERNGQFANYDEGALVGEYLNPGSLPGGPSTHLYITYAGGDGNDVVLYAVGVVPEPTVASLAIVCTMLLTLRRQRRGQ